MVIFWLGFFAGVTVTSIVVLIASLCVLNEGLPERCPICGSPEHQGVAGHTAALDEREYPGP